MGNALGPKLVAALLAGITLFFLGLACLEISALGAFLLPALALLLAPRATPRPHVAAWAALAATLWLCLRAQRLESPDSLGSQPSPRTLRLWALLPLWLGAQFHAGAAFAAAPLGLFCLESFVRARAARDLRAWLALLPALLAPLLLLLGPAGPASLVHLARHWALSEVIRIQEFDPWTWATEPLLPVLSLAALLGLWLGRKTFRWPALLATVLLFTLLALRTVRLVYECVVVCAPAVALFLEEVRRRQGRRAAFLALACATLLCLLPHQIAQAFGAVRFDPRWNERVLPVRAARFLDAHAVTGRGFNGLRDGGYLAWARPDVPIFIDARIHAYPAALWHALDRAEQSRPAFDAFLREEGAEWALTTRQRERMGGFRLLDSQPDWALVYWDETSALYLRRDQPRFANLIESFEYKLFHPWGDLLAQVSRSAASELALLERELARFRETSPGDATALLMECAAATREQRPDAGRRCDDAEEAASDPADPRMLELVKRARAQ